MKQWNNISAEKIMKNIIQKLIPDIFYISLITYLVYFMLELFKEGIISNYFDLNLLLIWTIIFGVLTIIFNAKSNKRR